MQRDPMNYSSETEQKIFDAATHIFIQRGRDGARMDDIAREAGINKALLHYYFRSKEKLYQEVFNREMRRVVTDLFRSVSVESEIRDFLKTFIDNYIDRINENPLVVRFMLWEIRSGASNFASIVQQVFTDTHPLTPKTIVEKIDRAARRREIRRVDGLHLLFNIIAMCIYTFIAEPIITAIFPGINVRNKSFITQRKKEIFHLIWDGIKP